MRFSPELMQFEIGISTRRYFPASGTAGFERSRVSGKRRVPCPPPIMIDKTFPMFTDVNFEPGIKTNNLRFPERPAPQHLSFGTTVISLRRGLPQAPRRPFATLARDFRRVVTDCFRIFPAAMMR